MIASVLRALSITVVLAACGGGTPAPEVATPPPPPPPDAAPTPDAAPAPSVTVASIGAGQRLPAPAVTVEAPPAIRAGEPAVVRLLADAPDSDAFEPPMRGTAGFTPGEVALVIVPPDGAAARPVADTLHVNSTARRRAEKLGGVVVGPPERGAWGGPLPDPVGFDVELTFPAAGAVTVDGWIVASYCSDQECRTHDAWPVTFAVTVSP